MPDLQIEPDRGTGDFSWRRNLIFTWLSQFFSLSGFCFCLPFIPYYIQSLGVTDKTELYIYVGLFSAGAPLTLAIMGPVWGQLADRYGRRLMMLRANVAGTFVIFGMAYTSSVEGLLVFRILQGLFTGTMPAAQALISTQAPPCKRGFALGALQSASFSGIMFGSSVGGLCADAFGYSMTFKLGGCMLALATLTIVLGVREDFHQPAATGSRGRYPPIGSALPILIMILAVGFGRFFDRPIMPLFVQSLNHGHVAGSSTMIGYLTAICCVAGIAGGLFFGRLVDRLSPGAIGTIIVCFGAVILSAHCLVTTFVLLLVVRFTLSFFTIGLDPVMQTWLSRVTSEKERGAAFGWATTFRALGWLLGPLGGTGIAAGLNYTGTPNIIAQYWVFFCGAVIMAMLVPLIGWSARTAAQTE